jgi:hypothetical protein
MHSVVVMIQIESNDPRLDLETVPTATVEGTHRLRQAVVQHIKDRKTRVIAVMATEAAELMMKAHDYAMVASGFDGGLQRPPPDYDPPPGR